MANHNYYPAYNPITGKYESFGGRSLEEARKNARNKGFDITDPNLPIGGDVRPNHRSNDSTDYAYWYHGRKI